MTPRKKQKKQSKKSKKIIKSMTGFGTGSQESPYGKITAEIKTLNHKNLSVSCNPFDGLFLLEEKVKEIIGTKLLRGKAIVRIAREHFKNPKSLHKIAVNEKTAKEYLKQINQSKKKLKVEGTIGINDLINLPGVLESSTEKKEETLWPYIKKALQGALENLVAYREAEGKNLAVDFERRLKSIHKQLQNIKKCEKQSIKRYRKRLSALIKDVLVSGSPDKNKLETEVALFARNCDIAEEITRLEGHIETFRSAMNNVKADAGKKLDFIAQEMQREINTIGSKSNDFNLARSVIEIKSEIEKMREQTKNIE